MHVPTITHGGSPVSRSYRRHGYVILTFVIALALIAGVIGYRLRQPSPATSGWRPAGLSGTLIHSLAVGRGGILFAGAHGGIYRRQGASPWGTVLGSGEIWAVALLADNRTVLAATGNGKVLVSRDDGLHWSTGPTLSPDGAFALAPVPGHPGDILAGAGGGIYRSTDGGRSWIRRLSLQNSAATAFSWVAHSQRLVLAGAVAGSAHGSTGVYLSRDAGITWHTFGHGLSSTGGIMSLSAASPALVFTGTMGNAAWRAGLVVGAWQKIASGMPATDDHVAALVSQSGHPHTLFAGTLGHGVFRTMDGGAHWTDISSGLPVGSQATTVLSLAYDSSSGALLAGTADGIYTLKDRRYRP